MEHESTDENIPSLDSLADSIPEQEENDEEPLQSLTIDSLDKIREDEEVEDIEEPEDDQIGFQNEELDPFDDDDGFDHHDQEKTGSSIVLKVNDLKNKVIGKFKGITAKASAEGSFQNEVQVTPGLNLESFKENASNINWASIPAIYFSKNFRPTAHKVYQISFAFFLFYTTTKIVGMLITGSTNYSTLTKKNYLSFDDSNKLSQADIKRIQSSKLFKTTQVKAQKVVEKPKVDLSRKCETATKKSSSKVKLINTIVLQDSVKSIAAVQVKSGNKGLKSIREGEVLPGNIKVDRIRGLKLIVKNLSTGECESIESTTYKKKFGRSKPVKVLSPKKSKEFKKKNAKIKGIETDGNNFKIDKKFLQSKLKDINSILTQARGIPIRNPDGSLSFKIVEIETGGVFDYLGITNGDLITEINGEPIKEINDVMNLFGKISNIPSLNLTLKRNGEAVTQNYNIK